MENKQDKGFTLVELLIVIVILGILATVTVFAVRGITDQGQNSACDTDRATLETAVEAFYAQNGTSVDPTEADLVPDFMVSQSDGYNIAPGATPGLATVAPSTGAAPAGECVGR
jgi:prepilin-type N-terminal cleavage/methylation domain-containing protein